MKKLSKKRVAGFILKPNSPEIKPIFEKIKREFESFGIKVLLSQKSADMIYRDGVEFNLLCRESDFLVSLGGDGTLLSLVRRSYGQNRPILGINAGNLGFLADITIDEVESFLMQLMADEYRIDNRMMIEGFIEKRDGRRDEFYAFNDVVVTRDVVSKMVNIDAFIDDEWFNTYRGDGLIISTPTGSTAYNLASGGPVIYPLTKAFIMTPICPHSLTQRPLVVPIDFRIGVSSSRDNVVAIIDGQLSYSMEKGDILRIKEAERDAKLLHRKERNYFNVLREKLSWGEDFD
jgi:NAD+ kinase